MAVRETGENRAGPSAEASVRAAIARRLRFQSLAAVGVATLALLVSPVAAYSALFGSLAAYIPAVVFANLVVRRIGPDSTAFLRYAVIGEVVKLTLTGLLCAAVFVWVAPLAGGWFFAGMIAVIVAGFGAALAG